MNAYAIEPNTAPSNTVEPASVEPNVSAESIKHSCAPYRETLYEFPASVRLLNEPAFKEKVLAQLHSRIAHNPEPRLYQLLVELYRKAGDLPLAIEAIQAWKALAANDAQAAHLSNILMQLPLAGQNNQQEEALTMRPAPFAIFDNFLDISEREYFWQKAIHSQPDFEKAGIGLGEETIVDCYQRDTEVLRLQKEEKKNIRDKVREKAKELFIRFQMPEHKIKKIEVKLTAHGEGGFFKIHHDGFLKNDGSIRCLSWVYYFHACPKRYKGGDLILFDSTSEPDGHQYSPVDYTRYIPQNNQVVFFPSRFYHCVTPVRLLSPEFTSGRFAIAGHVRC